MRTIDRDNIKELIENVETVDVKTKSGREFRILVDNRTGLIELQMHYEDFKNQNQGVTSECVLETNYQAYVTAVYFGSN